MVQSTSTQFDLLVNTSWILLETIKSSWTERQREVIQHRRQGLTYEKIGELLKSTAEKFITKQAVYNILKSAQWESASMGIHTLNHLVYPY